MTALAPSAAVVGGTPECIGEVAFRAVISLHAYPFRPCPDLTVPVSLHHRAESAVHIQNLPVDIVRGLRRQVNGGTL